MIGSKLSQFISSCFWLFRSAKQLLTPFIHKLKQFFAEKLRRIVIP